MVKKLGYLSGAPRVSTIPEAEAGGPRSHILGVISAFRELGWEVTPFIAGDHVPRSWVVKESGKTISGSFIRTLAADLIRLFLRFRNRRRAWKELEGKVDWVYERFGTFQALGKVFKDHDIPWILETNGLFYKEAKFDRMSLVLSRLARYFEVKSYQECDVLVCVTQALKELVVNEVGIPESKIIVLPNGVDTQLFKPESHVAKRLFQDFTVGFVGNMTVWQGLKLLLTAIHELDQELNLKINLSLVGDGLLLKDCKDLTDELGLTSQVTFTGRISSIDVPALIAGFDVAYLGTTPTEEKTVYHSPLKLYEYMAMGKPVIAAAIEDSLAILEDGKTGFLFEPGNLSALKQALVRAYNAQESLAAMGHIAQRKIKAEHSWLMRVKQLAEEVDKFLLRES